MSIKTINIGNAEKTLEDLTKIKEKNYGNIDIRINNLHLIKLNTLIGRNVFQKNDAFISAETLWYAMQPQPGEGKHHHHGLTESDVLEGLKSISDPHLIISTDQNRYLIVSLFISSFGFPLMIVIEIHSSLVTNLNANINKIVTLYPKDDIAGLIKKTASSNLLYKK